MKISTDKLYSKTRIHNNYPYFGSSQEIAHYFDDALDNLMALYLEMGDYSRTKLSKTEIRKCMDNLGKIKNDVIEISNLQNLEEEEEEMYE